LIALGDSRVPTEISESIVRDQCFSLAALDTSAGRGVDSPERCSMMSNTVSEASGLR
jgi:hypothetical protein